MDKQTVDLPIGVNLVHDLEFGHVGDRTLRLNLLLPSRPTASALPTIVWITGGAFKRGDRNTLFDRPPYRDAVMRLVESGFACASIDYRLSPEALFPAQIEDCKCCIRFLRANSAEYHLDPTRIGVWGCSAGGHLSALTATSGGGGEMEGNGGWQSQSSGVQAAVDWYGPTDFLRSTEAFTGPRLLSDGALEPLPNEPGSPESLLVGGPIQENREKVQLANPITHLRADCPPLLIMHGELDTLVPVNQSELLHAAALKAGVKSELTIVPGRGHEWLGEEAFARVRSFFEEHLASNRRPL